MSARITTGARDWPNALFGMIAQPAKRLVHFVPLNWFKNVVYETSLGDCRRNQSTLLEIT